MTGINETSDAMQVTMNNCCMRYGLEFNPFIKNSKEAVFMSIDYKEGINRLNYLREAKGFGLITGSAGKGKSTIVRNWANSLHEAKYCVIYTPLSNLSAGEFFRNFADVMKLSPAYRTCDNLKIIRSEILRLQNDCRKTPVFIIDEADELDIDILNSFKSLFNFEMDSKDKAIVVLTGNNRLNHKLGMVAMTAVRQRIVANFALEGMSKTDAAEYIRFKLSQAGATQDVFEPNAIEAIVNLAESTPRVINNLCRQSILIGGMSGANMISAEIVMQAFDDMKLQ